MSLDLAHEQLDWPDQKQVLTPRGAGPKVMAELAKAKIGQTLRRLPEGKNVKVGVLTRNADTDATEAPIAVVCDFPAFVSPATLREARGLAWNFCRCPLLITLEGPLIKAWTCCEPPVEARSSRLFGAGGGPIRPWAGRRAFPFAASGQLLTLGAAFVRGVLPKERETVQTRKTCGRDAPGQPRFLREELKTGGRDELKKRGLDTDVAHDLLARVIFIQFLFQRRDSSGQPALNEGMLHRLREEEHVLSKRYTSLPEILADKSDAYNLFRWLNEKFNGDLFPGKAATEEEREAEWQAEMRQVSPEHLRLLAQIAGGETEMKSGQKSLWPYYSFDTMPLEFISSIYEMFVDTDAQEEADAKKKTGAKTKVDAKRKGTHYTPGYIVDAVLDGVLPWDDKQWDLRILDPACGSGIFLVKAFQRLVHRWRLAHPGREPPAALLKRILERNLVGVDIDPHAVRVASFSLYLAMCDEIDPRHYWTQVKFPRLRNTRLVHGDFFDEGIPGIRTKGDAGAYDVVVGNAPWGKDTMTPHARTWSSENDWEISNEGIGTLFLPKAAVLTKPAGRVRMIQPAGSLLFNGLSTAVRFREKLLDTYKVERNRQPLRLAFRAFFSAQPQSDFAGLHRDPQRARNPMGPPSSTSAPRRNVRLRTAIALSWNPAMFMPCRWLKPFTKRRFGRRSCGRTRAIWRWCKDWRRLTIWRSCETRAKRRKKRRSGVA